MDKPDECFNSLFERASPADSLLAAAVVEVESGCNPFAVGDHGKALGLFQMHLDFVGWMFNEYQHDAAALAVFHGDPFRQAEAFSRFLQRFRQTGTQKQLEIYHYGLTATEDRYARHLDSDPDGTVRRYFDAYKKLGGTKAEYVEPSERVAAELSAAKPITS